MPIEVVQYEAGQHAAWDQFVAASKNGTFMLSRGYMEYHRDRFQDASLMICGKDGNLIGVFPANRMGDTILSHGGLTYGGLVVGDEIMTLDYLDAFAALVQHLQHVGYRSLEYKPVPQIYHHCPAQEDKYALFLLGVQPSRCEPSASIGSARRPQASRGRRSDSERAANAGLTVTESGEWPVFWEILRDNLAARHSVTPVHSLDEILELHGRFPKNIRLFCVVDGGRVIGGTVIYETTQVAHCQYIACTRDGRRRGALGLLFLTLIEKVYRYKPWFDFGISSINGGLQLNSGLVEFKERCGARLSVYERYMLDLTTAEPERLCWARAAISYQ